MTNNKYDFEIAMLSQKEVDLILNMRPNECSMCEWIINKGLFKTNEGWWITTEYLENSDIEHIEKTLGRKLINGITDQIVVNGRYASNQS